MANSSGILFHPTSHLDLVRPGIMLYGYAPRADHDSPLLSLSPVMEAKSYIARLRSLKPGKVIGYNALFRARSSSQIDDFDSWLYSRLAQGLTGHGHVLIQGIAAPIIGKFYMDILIVDVTDIPHPTIGEEVVLLGKQGEHEIIVEDYVT